MKPASQYKNVQVSSLVVLQMPGSYRVMHYWQSQHMQTNFLPWKHIGKLRLSLEK